MIDHGETIGDMPMSVIVGEASEEHIPELLRMGEQFIRTTSYAFVLKANLPAMERTARRLIAGPDSVVLVAQTPLGNLAGMLGLVAFDQPVSGERYVGEMFWWVDPDFRGTEIAHELLLYGERWAMQQGAVVINMIAPDPIVERLYQRWGYKKLEVTYHRRLDVKE